ncbi:hypothetical protein Q5752_000171 [Cryptotrichosporon argae]
MRFFGFGNNTTGCLVPGVEAVIAPTQLALSEGVERVVFHSWACTVAVAADGVLTAWGVQPLVDAINGARLSGVRHVIGLDTPLAFLLADGHVFRLASAGSKSGSAGPEVSNSAWDDVGVLDNGICLALRAGHGVVRFPSLSDLMHDLHAEPIPHPLLRAAVQIHTTESRALLATPGHTFELVFAFRDVHAGSAPSAARASLRLVEELEGMGAVRVRAGTGNRFAAVGESGQAWVLGKEVEAVDLVADEGDIDVALVGTGADFAVAVADTGLWVRGSNEFGQLGSDARGTAWRRLPFFDALDIVDVHCGRWSTIVSVR